MTLLLHADEFHRIERVESVEETTGGEELALDGRVLESDVVDPQHDRCVELYTRPLLLKSLDVQTSLGVRRETPLRCWLPIGVCGLQCAVATTVLNVGHPQLIKVLKIIC